MAVEHGRTYGHLEIRVEDDEVGVAPLLERPLRGMKPEDLRGLRAEPVDQLVLGEASADDAEVPHERQERSHARHAHRYLAEVV